MRDWAAIGFCSLLALVVGYSLAEPSSSKTILIGAIIAGVLSIPLMLRWHHPLLIVSWNSWLMMPFLPGNVPLWVFLACMSLGYSILQRVLTKRNEWLIVPSVTWPLIMIAIVTLITMSATQGFGGRSLGQDQWGGSKYLSILGAIVGYFALTAHPIEPRWGRILVVLFFASATTAIGATLVYALGPPFYFLFTLFPAELLAFQFEASPQGIIRYWGLSPAGRALCFALLAHYGLRGLIVWHQPWRGAFFAVVFMVGLFGGFRAYILLLGLVLISQFYFERLHLTRYVIYLMVFLMVSGVLVVGFIEHMPLPIQRALSFLPVEIHPEARRDAAGTLEWRLVMWKHVIQEIPNHLLLGKGFAFSGIDYQLTQEAIRRHLIYSSYDAAMISGAYHHGILTVLLPLGLPGLFAFLWFAWASLRVLHRNYKYGDHSLQKANTFLLAFFAAQLVFYLTLYGQFERDLPLFVGVICLSICINHGVRGPVEVVESRDEPTPVVEPDLAPRPAIAGS